MNPQSMWKFSFIGKLLLYNLIVFLAFLPFYFLIDYEKHFAYDSGKQGGTKPSWRGKLYFALMTHSTAGAGDIVPTSDLARTLMSLHILATWIQLVFVFTTGDAAASTSKQASKLLKSVASKAKIIVANSKNLKLA